MPCNNCGETFCDSCDDSVVCNGCGSVFCSGCALLDNMMLLLVVTVAVTIVLDALKAVTSAILCAMNRCCD